MAPKEQCAEQNGDLQWEKKLVEIIHLSSKEKCPSLGRIDGFAGGMAVRMQPYITSPDI